MNKGILNKSNLQLIAILAMVLDHTAYFVGVSGHYALFYLMHIIGRITIIIMCYFIAEGYYKTKNLDRYIIRMGIFAAISQIPFYLYKTGMIPNGLYSFAAGNYWNRNVIFTLFVALCLLTVLKHSYGIFIKIIATVAAFYLVRCSDWGWACVLWVLAFAFFRDKPLYQMSTAAFVVLLRVGIMLLKLLPAGNWDWLHIPGVLLQAGGLLAIPLLLMYNGEKGKNPGMGFYVFYPVHLLLLCIAKIIIFL